MLHRLWHVLPAEWQFWLLFIPAVLVVVFPLCLVLEWLFPEITGKKIGPELPFPSWRVNRWLGLTEALISAGLAGFFIFLTVTVDMTGRQKDRLIGLLLTLLFLGIAAFNYRLWSKRWGTGRFCPSCGCRLTDSGDECPICGRLR